MGARRTAVCTMVVAALLLTGCTSPAAAPTSLAAATPSPSPTAITLEQVKAAYKRYSEVSDAVSQDGGRGVDRLSTYVAPAQLAREIAYFAKLRKSGKRLEGASRTKNLALQRASDSTATAYVCVDYSGTRVISASGRDITPTSRSALQSFVVTFTSQGGRLTVASSDSWPGSDIC